MKLTIAFALIILTIGPAAAQQSFTPQQLFVLSAQEKVLFYPPFNHTWGNNYEDFPLKALWDAFDKGVAPVPMGGTGEAGWYDPNGSGSQNHALLWIGEAALAHAVSGNAAQFDIYAQRCLILLDSLDFVQGHMRHEGIGGYIGFWEGGIACMALAGYYAPAGSAYGPALLQSARRWWNDHIAVLRTLRMPDGQLGFVGARMNHGYAGDSDEENLEAAINLQLIDPQPHSTLHPYLAALIDSVGNPLHGLGGDYKTHWWHPRHVAQRWCVLRAFQSGALLRVSADHATPFINRTVYRWTSGQRTNIATPKAVGLPRCRFWVSWQAGQWVRIENADSAGTIGGKALPNGHLPQIPFNIPGTATQILGPIYNVPNPACASNNSCINDASIVSIATPFVRGCETSISPKVVVKNSGANAITDLAIYYQIDNNTLYSELSKGSIKRKRFTSTSGPGLLPGGTITLNLDASTVSTGAHTIKVWVMDVNRLTDPNASNDALSLTFNVVNNGYAAATYTEDFEGTNQGAIPSTWSSYNPDNDQKWFVFQSGGNKAAALNNNAYTGAVNELDELVMPPVNLTSSSQWYMLFDLCHASKPNSTVYDSLRVLASTDCGKTFTEVWLKGGSALNTVADQTALFVPSGPNDYRQEQINVSALSASSKVIFKFVNYSNNGNSTLIDNIKFSTTGVTSTNDQSEADQIQIYPNPTSDQIFISGLNGTIRGIEIKNAIGQLVISKAIVENNNSGISKIDVSSLESGIYLLTVSGSNHQSHHKIIIR